MALRAPSQHSRITGGIGFYDCCAGAITKDHAVPIIRIHHPTQCFCADDQAVFCNASLKIGISLDQCLHPTRTTEEQVIGNTIGVADAQVMLNAGRKRRKTSV